MFGDDKMIITADELLEHIKKHGITKARTEKDFRDIPKGTVLYFGINDNEISTFDKDTNHQNQQFKYNFGYKWCGIWYAYKVTFTILDDDETIINIMKWVTKNIKYQPTNEVKKMELKNIKKTNLKEAKKQYETEKANSEIEYAKQQLRIAEDKIDELDRQIKKLVEDKKPYEDIIKMFKGE
jgi:hypothetical protein